MSAWLIETWQPTGTTQQQNSPDTIKRPCHFHNFFFWNYKKNVLTNLLLINCLHNDREYSASQNGRSTLGRNFAKYLPIFTILSPTDSAVIVITEHLTAAYTRHYTTL